MPMYTWDPNQLASIALTQDVSGENGSPMHGLVVFQPVA